MTIRHVPGSPVQRHSPSEDFAALPGRLLLDTCVLNRLYDDSGYIFDGEAPSDGKQPSPDLEGLRAIFAVNQRANFELLVSPLTVAEISNTQDFHGRETQLRWVLDALDHWLILLDERSARVATGGTVRHRFKLTVELQAFETSLMEIADLRRDPIDRLLLVQYRMAACDAFLTTDRQTIWCHRRELAERGVCVLTPVDYWQLLRPWAALWL